SAPTDPLMVRSEAANTPAGVRLVGQDAVHRLNLLRRVPGQGRVEGGGGGRGVVGGQLPLEPQVLAAGRAVLGEGRGEGREGRRCVAHGVSLTVAGGAEASTPSSILGAPTADFPCQPCRLGHTGWRDARPVTSVTAYVNSTFPPDDGWRPQRHRDVPSGTRARCRAAAAFGCAGRCGPPARRCAGRPAGP